MVISPTALWIAFSLTVTSMLTLDLGLLQRTPRAPTTKEALLWSVAWIATATLFGLGITFGLGASAGTEFFTAYLIEKALSIDNLFVILLLFSHFKIPAFAQRKVLVAGVLGAIVLRATFILIGSAAVLRFHWLTYLLGAVLVAAAYKLVTDRGEDGAVSDGIAATVARKVFRVSDTLDGTCFFTRQKGALLATPLLLAVVAVEAADLVFALDSIPAVFGITRAPMIALTSNVFAILGLRSLFFLLAGLLARLRYLKLGLGVVLAFVGARMVLAPIVEIPTGVSLAVIVLTLSVAALASARGGSNGDDTNTHAEANAKGV